jgi:hypothetical protein
MKLKIGAPIYSLIPIERRQRIIRPLVCSKSFKVGGFAFDCMLIDDNSLASNEDMDNYIV